MEPIDLAALADDFDREVAATPAIDRFCSSAAWVLSASAALMPPRAPYTFRGPAGYFAAMRGMHPAGFPYVEPLELAWGLASPLIGRDPDAIAAEVVALLASRRDWQVAVLPGLTADGPQRRALERELPSRWELQQGAPTLRHVASLAGGVDGFLARRSRELRKTLRKGTRAATDAGLSFESVRARSAAEAGPLYARIQAAEAASWKAREGVGIAAGPMRAFYEQMLPRLCERGHQRTVFARAGDRDVGYILGAVFEGEYRGLQFSYDDDRAGIGIGGLLQLRQIAELCDEGIERYDLGTEMDYKRRWAEDVMTTELVFVIR